MLEDVFSDGLQVGDVWDVTDIVRHSLDYNVTRWEHKLVGTHLRNDTQTPFNFTFCILSGAVVQDPPEGFLEVSLLIHRYLNRFIVAFQNIKNLHGY